MDRAESTALLKEARDGSPEALDRLYARVAGRLLAIIRLRLGPDLRARLESRDILQATLLRSFQHLDRFEGEGGTSLIAWLARIAEREILDQVDYLHRGRRDAARELPLADGLDRAAAHVKSALSQAALGEEVGRLHAAIETLEPDYREVILLRKLEERPFREVAARMGRTEDACRMLLVRAMAALTVALHETA